MESRGSVWPVALEYRNDPELFGRTFRRNWRGADTWQAWRVLLGTLFALPLTDEQKALALKHTGRTTLPTQPVNEAYLDIGRRGKTRIASLIAVFLAAFYNYESLLAAGETGIVSLIAPDRKQAKVLLDYVRGFLCVAPMLERMVVRETAESIELSNHISIEVRTASYRTIRGLTLVAAIVDECAFLPTDFSAEPDSELLTGIRPLMATIPTSMLLCISTPYSRKGELYRACQEHFGKDSSPVIFWNASSLVMNPSLAHRIIETAFQGDPLSAASEYGWDGFVQFRSDVEGFLSAEVVAARVVQGRFELPPLGDVSYTAFCDPSGGQSDSMTLAIAHVERGTAVLDCLREVLAPFSPQNVVAEFSDLLKRYRVSTVIGDRYSGAWCSEAFQRRGIEYRPSEKTRSELYLELLPTVMSGQIELLDNRKLIAQLVSLERRPARGGRDRVDHSPGAHDDLANSAAGALVKALHVGAGVYGLTEYFSSGHAEADLRASSPGTAVLERVRARQEKISEQATICPNCGSNLVRKMSSGTEMRCQQCAAQFGLPLKPSVPMSRAEWLRPPGRG